jgi:hypothetical protein
MVKVKLPMCLLSTMLMGNGVGWLHEKNSQTQQFLLIQSCWACFGLYPSSCMWKTYKTMDRVQNKSNSSVQHTPSSESFQVYQFLLSYCIGAFVGSIMVWGVKELACVCCNTIKDSHSLCCNGTSMRMMGNTARGGWEKCCVVGEHMHMTNLFVNNFTKMVSFLWRFYQLDENLRCFRYHIVWGLLILWRFVTLVFYSS